MAVLGLLLLWPLLSLVEGQPNNVLGSALELCSDDPLTGWFRDGFCRTDENDQGSHTVCAELTGQFLEYTRARGNDLSSPRPGFPGLRPGDHWCLCAARWRESMRAGVAPPVVLAATHSSALTVNSLSDMDNSASDNSVGSNGHMNGEL